MTLTIGRFRVRFDWHPGHGWFQSWSMIQGGMPAGAPEPAEYRYFDEALDSLGSDMLDPLMPVRLAQFISIHPFGGHIECA